MIGFRRAPTAFRPPVALPLAAAELLAAVALPLAAAELLAAAPHRFRPVDVLELALLMVCAAGGSRQPTANLDRGVASPVSPPMAMGSTSTVL